MKFFLTLLFTVLFSVPILFFLQKKPKEIPIQTIPKMATQSAIVTRVFDGDTIEINNQEKVRYIGINTPETEENSCFAEEAKQYNASLVLGKTVYLEPDTTNTDRYGRMLRYVYTTEGTFINKTLIQEGFARVFTVEPNTRYKDMLLKTETQAKQEQKGLWGQCRNNTPQLISTQNPACTIKGNRNTENHRLYHLPSCPDYQKTQININNGEFWFCTEQEAINAGFQKAKNCP